MNSARKDDYMPKTEKIDFDGKTMNDSNKDASKDVENNVELSQRPLKKEDTPADQNYEMFPKKDEKK